MQSAFTQGILQTPLAVNLGGTGLSSLGSALQVIRVNAGATALEYAAAGTGDVVGPSSATNEAIVLYDGTTGKLVKNSTATINTSGVIVSTSMQPTAGVLAGSASQTTTTAAAGQLFGSTSTHYQLGTGGITATLTAGFSAVGTLLRQSTFTEAATGTHPLIANLAVRAPGITNGAGSTTNAVTLYVEGAPSGTASPTNVYAVWVDAGEVRIDGDIGDTTNRVAKAWVTNLESTNMPTVGGTSLSSTFAALAGSTGQVFSVSSLELGNTDTTLSRSAAGVIAVEGVVIPSISSTNTLTNKRITKRVGTTTSSATPTINTDNVDYYSLTAQTVDITSFTTNLSGTPTDGQTLWISITGTAARAITWGASFEASTVALPTTTVSTNRLDVGFVWNAATSKWRCVSQA